MANLTETIANKTSKLNSKQTFILLIILVIITSLPNYVSRFTTSKTDVKLLELLEDLNRNVNKQNLNHVDYSTAMSIYRTRISSSMFYIALHSMRVIEQNHIDNPVRRKSIIAEYKTIVPTLYYNDCEELRDIYYNDKALVGLMIQIDPNHLTNGILDILFNQALSHSQRRSDILDYIVRTGNKYEQLAKTYINEQT